MLDYQKILSACHESSRISKSFVDEFLLYFIGDNEGLEAKFSRQLSNYRKIILKMPEEFPGMLMSQLIVHRIFQKNGLAGAIFFSINLLASAPGMGGPRRLA